jgi:penicillin-binding protein 1B
VAVKVQVHRKALLVRFLLNPWGKAFLLTFILASTAALGVGTYYYVKYSRLLEAKLKAGPFANTAMLFGAPHLVTVGDPGTPEEIVDLLRRSGYSQSHSDDMGYYNLRRDAVEIYPGPESYFRREPGVIKFARGKVSEIISLQDNTQISQYMLEPELITNLFDKKREKRRVVHFAEIPQVMVNAVLAAEDKRFFNHAGIDPFGILRSAWVDMKERRHEQGASTLTMQLARSLLLDASDRSWRRKIPEVLLTVHLEQKLTKQQIFEFYANTIYLGQRGSFSIHGFGEGANVYFGKDLDQLKLEEAALLAGLVQSPNMRNPFRYPERAKTRRNVVLGMMRDNGFITPDQYQQAVAAPLQVVGEGAESTDAPYFVDLVNDSLQSQFQDRDFQSSSYKIYTSLDMDLQRDAAEAIHAGMDQVDPLLKRRFKGYGDTTPLAQVALVAIDPHTGEIKALMGGRNYGASQLDRALSRRPPGSVFKPFVYTAALNTGLTDGTAAITPVSTFADEPTTFYYGEDKTYQPSNYHQQFNGTVTLRQALTKSLNIPTVKIAERVGYGNVLALARSAGLNIDAPPTPAIALGSVGVTPIDVSGAYTIFANQGVWVKPNYIEEIRDQKGSTIFRNKPVQKVVLDPRVAYLVTNLLEDVLRTGTGASVRARGFDLPAAGKTGSSHDAWFAGFTSKLLCIVWVGFDDYRDVKLEGAKAALPIWTEFMKRAHQHSQYRNVTPFEAPEGIVSAEIDPESGQLATSACPTYRPEVFIAGTQPVELCHLHGGGGTQVASWDTPAQSGATPPIMPAAQPSVKPGSQQTVRSIPVNPAQQPEPPPEPAKKKKGFWDRVKGIFK